MNLTLMSAAQGAEALAHLLACLEDGARALHEEGKDVDAYVIRAHVAQLQRGREWPGDTSNEPFTPEGHPRYEPDGRRLIELQPFDKLGNMHTTPRSA